MLNISWCFHLPEYFFLNECLFIGPAFEIKYGCPKTCADEKSTKFCKKQKKKGNCKKSKVYKVCMETCGKC